jgi:hypothetical protein
MSDDTLNFAPGMTHGAPGLYLTGEDNLRLTTWGALAGAIVTVEGRVIRPDGVLEPFVETDTPNSDRTAKTKIIRRAEGFLTNVTIRVSTGSAIRGHVFALLDIIRGDTGGVVSLGTLCQGYVTNAGRLTWPEGPNEPHAAGFGRIRTIVGTDPAAGVEISETVPAGARWRLQTFGYTFVTDATVANRRPVFTVDDGANVLWEDFVNVAQTATQTVKYRAGATGSAALYDTLAYRMVVPTWFLLAAGSRIRTVTAGLVAGDNFGAPIYSVEEWLEP